MQLCSHSRLDEDLVGFRIGSAPYPSLWYTWYEERHDGCTRKDNSSSDGWCFTSCCSRTVSQARSFQHSNGREAKLHLCTEAGTGALHTPLKHKLENTQTP